MAAPPKPCPQCGVPRLAHPSDTGCALGCDMIGAGRGEMCDKIRIRLLRDALVHAVAPDLARPFGAVSITDARPREIIRRELRAAAARRGPVLSE